MMEKTFSDRIPVIDGHVDLLYSLMRYSPGTAFSALTDGEITPDRLREGNVRLIISAFYCADPHNGPVTARAHLNDLYAQAQTLLRGLTPILSAGDLEQTWRGTGEPGVLYLLENADALVDENVSRWQARGIRVVGLTHAGENRIGSGNGVNSSGGLTAAGLRLVRELARLGIVIDVAHLSDPCFWQLMDCYSGPLISSHTGFRRFCHLPRNLSDEQVRVLMDRNGMIGVSVNPDMLDKNLSAGLFQVVEQIDWLVQQYGDHQVAIGSDFGGFESTAPGMEHPGKFQSLAGGLQAIGYSQSAVENILGNNWYRFYKKLLSKTVL